jgi:hypothetical protein
LGWAHLLGHELLIAPLQAQFKIWCRKHIL